MPDAPRSILDQVTRPGGFQPMGADAQSWAARVDPKARGAIAALQAHAQAQKDDSGPTIEDEGTAGHEESQGLGEGRHRTIEWSPVSRAIGLLLGAGHAATKDFGTSYLAGKRQADEDIRQRNEGSNKVAPSAARIAWNAVGDLGDLVSAVPGIAAETLLPHEAPPGAENEGVFSLDSSLRNLGEGAAFGKQVSQGLIGGTAAILNHPLDALAARPFSTLATYAPGVKAAVGATRAAKAGLAKLPSNAAIPWSGVPVPGDAGGLAAAPGPHAPTTEQLHMPGERPLPDSISGAANYPLEELAIKAAQSAGSAVAEPIRAAAEKYKDTPVLGKAMQALKRGLVDVPERVFDQYMAKLADGFHSGDPRATMLAEAIARGGEHAKALISSAAQQLADTVNRDMAHPPLQPHRGHALPGLPVEQQVSAPGEAHLQTEADLARGLHPVEERVARELQSGGKEQLPQSSHLVPPAPEPQPVPRSRTLGADTRAAIERTVDELIKAAGLEHDVAKQREFRPAMTQDVMLAMDDVLGHDGNSANWKGQMRADPERFAKEFIDAAEAKLERPLGEKEKAGILEAIDRHNKDGQNAPRTGLETKDPQEWIHAQKVVVRPDGTVGREFTEESPQSEKDAAFARKKAIQATERDNIRATAKAEAAAESHRDVLRQHDAAELAAHDAHYHATGAADIESNARAVKQQAERAAVSAKRLATEKASAAVKAQAAAEAAAERVASAERLGAKGGALDALRAKAETAGKAAESLADEASEALAEAERAAKVAKVRGTEHATREIRKEKARQDLIAAQKAHSVTKTLLSKSQAAMDAAGNLAESTGQRAEAAALPDHPLEARRLARTRVIPVVGGVELDPHKMLGTRELTPQERATALTESMKHLAKRYSGPSEMGGGLEREAHRVVQSVSPEVDHEYERAQAKRDAEAITKAGGTVDPKMAALAAEPEGPAAPFIKAAQQLTYDTDAGQIVVGAESKHAAQATLAKTAYGIVKGIGNGDLPPQVLPQGLRPAALRKVILDAVRGTPAEAKVKPLAIEIGGYQAMDPITGYGTEARPTFAQPLFADAMYWHAKASDAANTGLLAHINQLIKANLTTRSLSSGINNIVPNLAQVAIRRGWDPVSYITRAETLMNEMRKWHKDGAAAVGDVRSRAFKNLADAGNQSHDFVSNEIDQNRLSPSERLRAGAVGKSLDSLKGMPQTKFSEWFYQHGDHIIRVEEGVTQFERIARDIDGLKSGEYYDLQPTRRQTVRIGKEGDRFTVQDPSAPMAADRKPTYATQEQIDRLIGKDAARKASNLVQDYPDLPQMAKAIKSVPHGFGGPASPMISWAASSLDLFGKAGLAYNTFLRSPYAVNTNSAAALGRAMRAESGLAMRRAITTQGVRSALQQQGANGPLANDFRQQPDDDQQVIINKLTRPGVVEGVKLGQWAQIGPTGDLARLVAHLLTLPQAHDEHDKARKGELTAFGKEVVAADSGQGFTVPRALKLAYMSGSPLLQIYHDIESGKGMGELARTMGNALVGGTNMGLGRAAAGYASDTGQEDHPRLPIGDTRDFLAQASGRNRAVTDKPETTMPILTWMVQQVIGKGWVAKDFDAADPKVVKSFLHNVRQALHDGLGAASAKKISDAAADAVRKAQPHEKDQAADRAVGKASGVLHVGDVVDATIEKAWQDYQRAYLTLYDKQNPEPPPKPKAKPAVKPQPAPAAPTPIQKAAAEKLKQAPSDSSGDVMEEAQKVLRKNRTLNTTEPQRSK